MPELDTEAFGEPVTMTAMRTPETHSGKPIFAQKK